MTAPGPRPPTGGSRCSSATFGWALREHLIAQDPTLKLQSARQALRVPKTLTEAQVEALLAAPDTATALGQRDRTMLEADVRQWPARE
jgi:site-specific recombinase XerD